MSIKRRADKQFQKQRRELVEAIRIARAELEAAESFFQNAEDPKLIEVAIYHKQAALKSYEYLLKEAKRVDLSVDTKDLIDGGAIIIIEG